MPDNWNSICPYCLVVNRHGCPKHPGKSILIGSRPRVPKKDASKFRWKEFFKVFPSILTRMPVTKKLKKLNLK